MGATRLCLVTMFLAYYAKDNEIPQLSTIAYILILILNLVYIFKITILYLYEWFLNGRERIRQLVNSDATLARLEYFIVRLNTYFQKKPQTENQNGEVKKSE
eukprot:TRINITY_DN13765_c0_g1_i3.p1 TRINITY_DN13765_c0_g1~~TRINITY_DN13765_c0_g1_i3.p1  ORF type:complete len:102 (+),score=19.98 TRINITY_DN13765_c0_g1_i3:38-343(+)